MVDTLTSVCFHHGKVTIHLSSTGVNMDEGVNDFLHDFRDSRMGHSDIQSINTRQTSDQTVDAILPCQASQCPGELYKDVYFTDTKMGSRILEACLRLVRDRVGTESQMWLAHVSICIEWLSWVRED